MLLVTTFNQACKHKGLDPEKCLPDVSMLPKEQQKAVLATAKLFIIVDVLNDGHKFNWETWEEEKWVLWWWMNKPGFRLSAASYADSTSAVGSRLCYRTKALALHAAKHFKSLYQDLMVQ